MSETTSTDLILKKAEELGAPRQMVEALKGPAFSAALSSLSEADSVEVIAVVLGGEAAGALSSEQRQAVQVGLAAGHAQVDILGARIAKDMSQIAFTTPFTHPSVIRAAQDITLFDQIPEHIRATVSKVTPLPVVYETSPEGERVVISQPCKIEFYDRQKALERLLSVTGARNITVSGFDGEDKQEDRVVIQVLSNGREDS